MFLYPNFKESQTELKTDCFSTSKFFQKRAEEPFFQEIAPLLNNRVKTEIFDTEPVQTPNNVALQKICNHYQTKYSIEIQLVDASSLPSLWNELKTRPDKPFYMGIILREQGDKPYGHVCPLLCHFAPDREECYILDVLGDTYPFYEHPISQALTALGVENIYTAKGKRQVDTDSCRIGAVTLLRNALLWIKKNNSQESLKSILEMLKVNETEFNIPLEWSYTEQIYPKNCDLSQMFVIRDFYSKKQKKPRTIREFREQYNKEGTFNCCIFLPASVKIPSPIPDDMEITQRSRKKEIAYSVTLTRVNRYLQEKGNFEKLRANNL